MTIKLKDKEINYNNEELHETVEKITETTNNDNNTIEEEYKKQDLYDTIKHFEVAEATNYDIYNESVVKLTTYKNGNMDIQDNLNYNREHKVGNIIWKSKTERINTETGEIIKCKDTGPYRSNESITNSMRKYKKLILNNFYGDKNELFITLTYAKAVEDFDIVKKDIEDFCDKLREYYKGIQYVYVIEIQEERQSWHAHLIVKDTKEEKTKITNKKIKGLWGKGETKTKKVTNIKGLANYICKTRSKAIKEIANNNDNFKVKKGRRIIGCSEEITRPEEQFMLYKEAKELVKDKKYDGDYTYRVVQVTEHKNELTDDIQKEECTFNKIKVEHYKVEDNT